MKKQLYKYSEVSGTYIHRKVYGANKKCMRLVITGLSKLSSCKWIHSNDLTAFLDIIGYYRLDKQSTNFISTINNLVEGHLMYRDSWECDDMFVLFNPYTGEQKTTDNFMLLNNEEFRLWVPTIEDIRATDWNYFTRHG